MRYLATAAASLLVLMLALPLAAQYPGRYPSGSPVPVPRRSKDKKTEDKSKQQELQSLTGILRKIDATSVTIVAPDTRTITAKFSDGVKIFKKGEESSASSLHSGDRVRIDATQDEQGFFHAVAIYVESEATPQEKSAATTVDSENAGSTPEREPTATKVVAAAELDPDRPRTRRGKPPPRNSTAAAETASNELPPSTPPEARSSAPPSDATPPREDVRIAKAREAVAAYTRSLPNYSCQQQIARFASTTQKVDWRPLDVVSAAVVSENGRDEYRDLTINGKRINKRMEEIGGAWSTGEFGMMIANLFSPATAAEFSGRGGSRINGKEAVLYDFEVDREHSHWHIQAPSQSILPAYKGRVWLEKDTAEVLRIEMQTSRMPKEFPLDKVESAVDYEYVLLGGQRFLLPVHAETLTCVRGTNNCSRNVIDFRNYRKYGAESTVTFDK
jgi:hypothetical protein